MKLGLKTISLYGVTLCIALSIFGCVSYPKEVKKTLTRVYGYDFPSYSFRGSPVGNFGAGTIYAAQFVDRKGDSSEPLQPQEAWLMAHPNTWYADTVTKKEREELDKKIFERGSMGSATLKEKISTRLKLSVSIPNLAEVLNAGATVDYEKGVKVTLKSSAADNRQMNWSEFKKAVSNGKLQPYITDLIDSGNIVVAAQDIILKGYSAEIQVEQTVNPELNAKLNEAIGKVLGVDSKLSVGITKKSEGVFEVTATDPVVAAVLYVRPPKQTKQKAVLGGVDKIIGPTITPPESLDKWDKVVISNTILDPVEKFLTTKGLPKAPRNVTQTDVDKFETSSAIPISGEIEIVPPYQLKQYSSDKSKYAIAAKLWSNGAVWKRQIMLYNSATEDMISDKMRQYVQNLRPSYLGPKGDYYRYILFSKDYYPPQYQHLVE